MYTSWKLFYYKKEINKKDLLDFYKITFDIIYKHKDKDKYIFSTHFSTGTESCDSFEEFKNEVVINFKYKYFSFIFVCCDISKHKVDLTISFTQNFDDKLSISVTTKTNVEAEEIIEGIGTEIVKLSIDDENKENITKVEIHTSNKEREYIESKDTIKDKIEKHRFWIGILLGGISGTVILFILEIILHLLKI